MSSPVGSAQRIPFWTHPGARRMGLLQGAFYVVTGFWPVVHLPSFLYVTGPKVDLWLVQTVGALLAVSGVALALAAWRGRLTAEWALLASGQAATLAIVDIVFVSRGRIPAIYLGDAAAEILLIIGWILVAVRARAAATPPTR